MRRAQPHELQEDAVAGLVLHLSESRREELFPVPLEPMDPLSEAEPSLGALVQLESGVFVMVVYGTITRRTTISFPASADLGRALRAFFTEIPVLPSEIIWTAQSPLRTVAR